MQKIYVDRKIEKSRVIIYCLEASLAIIGLVMFILAMLKINFGSIEIPMGSRISSSLMAILLAFAFMAVELIFRYRFPIMLHIIYFAYVFASVIVGSNFGVFRHDVLIMGDMMGWYDKITHAILGYILCVIAIYLSQRGKVWGKSKFGDILLIVAISMAYASIWEMFEFTVDHTIPNQSMQRNSLIDTMLDIIAHFVFTVVFVIQYIIEKCAGVNLGIAFMEKNLNTGGWVPRKNQELPAENTGDSEAV
ncbi:MAG: hypothetical protein K2P12_05615 [Clostridia bacterium]|nr:hypothetical protein [Clostridia bacterium]